MVNGNSQAPVDLASNSVMLVLRLGRPGNRRKVHPSLVSVDADPDALYIGKELLESDELKAVVSLDDGIRRWVYTRSLPSFGTLKEGVYRLPLTLVDQVDETLETFRQDRQALIVKFLERYPVLVEDARTRLRALYNAGDYPPAGEIAARFTFSYRYLAFMAPETLSARLLAREREKAAAEVASEVEEIKTALRTSFAELVSHAADRLGVKPNGQKLVFRDSMVQNLEDFLGYFGARNLVNDTELATLVDRARNVMSGLAAEDLRTNDGLRAQVKQTFDGIKAEMDRNLLTRPSRRLILDREA